MMQRQPNMRAPQARARPWLPEVAAQTVTPEAAAANLPSSSSRVGTFRTPAAFSISPRRTVSMA